MILKDSNREILDVLKLCASPQRLPVLIHCSHGKDRTGLMSALIQAAVGVDVKDIVSDYVASETLGGVELCTAEVKVGPWP
jgi:protein tyrosine/serine phosphatase